MYPWRGRCDFDGEDLIMKWKIFFFWREHVFVKGKMYLWREDIFMKGKICLWRERCTFEGEDVFVKGRCICEGEDESTKEKKIRRIFKGIENTMLFKNQRFLQLRVSAPQKGISIRILKKLKIRCFSKPKAIPGISHRRSKRIPRIFERKKSECNI